MLQPKQNKASGNKCIKPIVLLILFIAGFFLSFIPWFFVYFFFVIEKNSRGIKGNLNISEIIDISGITDCINNSLRNLGSSAGNYRKIEDIYKEKKEFFQKTIYDKKFRKKKAKPDFSYSKNKKSSLDEELNFQVKTYSKIKTKSKSHKKSNRRTTGKTNFSNEYNLFNDGKSIWDDYESVIDIMEKNQTK